MVTPWGSRGTYLAFPGHVVRLESAAVERNQEAGAAISVCQGHFRNAHLLAGRLCASDVSKGNRSSEEWGDWRRRG